MSHTRVALIVDHPQRDLAGIVLLAHELCRRGAVCHLVPLNVAEREIFSLAPDFVLLNFLRIPNTGFAKDLVAAGIRFGVLDTEGGVWTDPVQYAENLSRDAALRAQASPVCIWGRKLADYLVQNRFFSESQVAVTGCPRFDLYSPRWRPLLADGNGAHRPGRRKRILINTNFSVTNSRFVSAETNLNELKTQYGWTDERLRGYVESEPAAIRAIIALAERLATDYPAVQVVIRPHPFERTQTYSDALAGTPTVEVNGTGPVHTQIFRADAVIQRSCTTAIEAGLASVPALSPLWVPAPVVIPMSEEVSVPCAAYADLKGVLDEILAGRYRPPERLRAAIDTVVDDWFCGADGNACRRVSERTLAAARGARTVDAAVCDRFLYGLHGAGNEGALGAGRMLRRAAGLPPDFSFRWMKQVPFRSKKDKQFSGADVVELLARIQSLDGDAGAPAVRAVLARESGDYSRGYFGHAVTLAAA